ncbi:MAG: efflux RND transporter periplasmic adaptor subunit, partial [Candidatus Eisenbacteria bacterium]|nr:efflux RND transporter periplasmic adaptor subunit [Candidatus Eisenbacteria bacterium]
MPLPSRTARDAPSFSRSILLGGAIAVLALAGCAGGNARARAPRVPVTVAKAERRAVPFTLTSTGTVEPVETAAVGSQVGGVVTRVAFREGQEVRQGDVLFQLDPRPLRAVYDRAAATLAKDRAQESAARNDAERARRLFEQNVISQADWDQRRSAWESLAATVRA